MRPFPTALLALLTSSGAASAAADTAETKSFLRRGLQTDCSPEGTKAVECGTDTKSGRPATCCAGLICGGEQGRFCVADTSSSPFVAPSTTNGAASSSNASNGVVNVNDVEISSVETQVPVEPMEEEQVAINPLADQCSPEGEKSVQCGGKPEKHAPKCCGDLICGGEDNKFCKVDLVKLLAGTCSAEGEKSFQCGGNPEKYAPECCAGLKCGGEENKYCKVDVSQLPGAFQTDAEKWVTCDWVGSNYKWGDVKATEEIREALLDGRCNSKSLDGQLIYDLCPAECADADIVVFQEDASEEEEELIAFDEDEELIATDGVDNNAPTILTPTVTKEPLPEGTYTPRPGFIALPGKYPGQVAYKPVCAQKDERAISCGAGESDKRGDDCCEGLKCGGQNGKFCVKDDGHKFPGASIYNFPPIDRSGAEGNGFMWHMYYEPGIKWEPRGYDFCVMCRGLSCEKGDYVVTSHCNANQPHFRWEWIDVGEMVVKDAPPALLKDPASVLGLGLGELADIELNRNKPDKKKKEKEPTIPAVVKVGMMKTKTRNLCLEGMEESDETQYELRTCDPNNPQQHFYGIKFDGEKFQLYPKRRAGKARCMTMLHHPLAANDVDGERIIDQACYKGEKTQTVFWTADFRKKESEDLDRTGCSSSDKCDECAGFCDDDSECKGDLYCYPRGERGWRTNLEMKSDPNPWAKIPGCKGYGVFGKNYCSKKPYNEPYDDKEIQEILDAN